MRIINPKIKLKKLLHKIWVSAFVWRILFILILMFNFFFIAQEKITNLQTNWERRKTADTLSDREYFDAVYSIALKQLESTRKKFLGDPTAVFRVTQSLRDLETNRSEALTFPLLTRGILFANLIESNLSGDKVLKKYYQEFLKQKIYILDQTADGDALIYLEQTTHNPEYQNKIEEMATYLIERSKKEGGTLAFRPWQDGKKSVRHVDTLGLACPFLAHYGSVYNKPEATELAVRQVLDFIQYGLDSKSGLSFQGYNPSYSNLSVGAAGWGRGVGWYALGLVNTAIWLPKESKELDKLTQAINDLARGIVRYQQSDGGYLGLLTANVEHYDSSATSILTYFLKVARTQGWIGPEYDGAILRGVASLKAHTRSNGIVDDAQGVCMGLNQMSSQYGPETYAQGMTLELMGTITRGQVLNDFFQEHHESRN